MGMRRTGWVAFVGLVACALMSCSSDLPDFTAKPANRTAESIEQASAGGSTTVVAASAPTPTSPPTTAPVTAASPSPTAPGPAPSAAAFCAAWAGVPEVGSEDTMTAKQEAARWQAEIDYLNSKVRPVTPAELVGDLDNFVSDIRAMVQGMQRAGDAPAKKAYAGFTADELAAGNRMLAFIGKDSGPDASGHFTITFPNALAAWTSDPCGPKPLQDTIKGAFVPVGNSLN
jgi:hypothetical protein